MKAQLFVVSVAMFFLIVPRAHAESDREAVAHLASDIAARASSADSGSLAQVRSLLEAARELLGERGTTSGECMRVALAVYERSLPSSAARKSALAACSRGPDMGVLGVARPIFERGYPGRNAFERALEMATDDGLRGRVELLRLGTEALSRSYPARDALRRAADAVRGAPPTITRCVVEGYESHSTRRSSNPAFTAALEECGHVSG